MAFPFRPNCPIHHAAVPHGSCNCFPGVVLKPPHLTLHCRVANGREFWSLTREGGDPDATLEWPAPQHAYAEALGLWWPFQQLRPNREPQGE